MDRRRVAAVLVLAFLVGAVFAHAWPDIASRSSIDDRRFTASSSGELDSESDSPRIALNRSERRLIVSGQLLVGSATCNRATVGDVEHNENADTLTVLVTAGDRGLTTGSVQTKRAPTTTNSSWISTIDCRRR